MKTVTNMPVRVFAALVGLGLVYVAGLVACALFAFDWTHRILALGAFGCGVDLLIGAWEGRWPVTVAFWLW